MAAGIAPGVCLPAERSLCDLSSVSSGSSLLESSSIGVPASTFGGESGTPVTLGGSLEVTTYCQRVTEGQLVARVKKTNS